MKKNKFLVLVQDDKIINDLRECGVNMAFPLKSFSVGYLRYFDEFDIPNDAFLYVNKSLDNDDLDRLNEILHRKKFEGIIFDDLGVLSILKDLNIKKILYMPHQLCNASSVNYMLDYVDSVLLCTDLTKDETEYILNNSKKDLSIYGFGYVSVMYSKRTLIDNYYNHYQLNKDKTLQISVDDKKLIGIESSFGTVFYSTPCLKNFEFNDYESVRYVFINTVMLDIKDILKLLKTGKTNIDCDDGFLNKPTIYKLKGGDNNA